MIPPNALTPGLADPKMQIADIRQRAGKSQTAKTIYESRFCNDSFSEELLNPTMMIRFEIAHTTADAQWLYNANTRDLFMFNAGRSNINTNFDPHNQIAQEDFITLQEQLDEKGVFCAGIRGIVFYCFGNNRESFLSI